MIEYETLIINCTGDEAERAEEIAIRFGFASVSDLVPIFVKMNMMRIEGESTDGVMRDFMQHKADFDESFDSFFDDPSLRSAFYFWRAARNDVVMNEQINNKKEELTKLVNARNTIEQLLGREEFMDSFDDIIPRIDTAIRAATTTRGVNSKKYKARMDQELAHLSNSKKREILRNFASLEEIL